MRKLFYALSLITATGCSGKQKAEPVKAAGVTMPAWVVSPKPGCALLRIPISILLVINKYGANKFTRTPCGRRPSAWWRSQAVQEEEREVAMGGGAGR